MSPKSTGLIILLAVLVLLGANSYYVVKETERAVELRFGEILEEDVPPGLHWKVPLVDRVHKFDARILTLDTQAESFFTSERKRLITDSYVKWRIADVGAYYRATGGNEDLAHNRLSNRVNDSLRNEFGTRTLHEVVSGERDQLMAEVLTQINTTVLTALGIEVIDVRVKRIDLPDEVKEQVFRRMQAEREKEARQLRAVGLEEAEEVRADADRQATVIRADAYSESQKIRGRGDARATSVYAGAYNQDPEFYAFTRSLEAYRKSFSNKGDILLVDPDSDYFRYLNDAEGQ